MQYTCITYMSLLGWVTGQLSSSLGGSDEIQMADFCAWRSMMVTNVLKNIQPENTRMFKPELRTSILLIPSQVVGKKNTGQWERSFKQSTFCGLLIESFRANMRTLGPYSYVALYVGLRPLAMFYRAMSCQLHVLAQRLAAVQTR